MVELTTLFFKVPRNNEYTPEAAQTFLSALTQLNAVGRWDKLMGKKAQPLALEIVLSEQQIRFMITCEAELAPFVEAQIQSNYPLAISERVRDPLEQTDGLHVQTMKLAHGNYYPLMTYPSFVDVDPLASVLTILSKAPEGELVIIQFALEAISGSWQTAIYRTLEYGVKDKEGNRAPLPDEAVIREKISFPGFAASLRIAARHKNTLATLASAFGVFSRNGGNSLAIKRKGFLARDHTLTNMAARKVSGRDIFNIAELATLWHLPGEKVKVNSIVWGNAVLSEAPENLPAANSMSEDERKKVNFFAKTQFKNTETIFGVKDNDRRRHVWVVGKTGTGKSTLIANMVIDDLKKGRAVAVVDPHGDLCETVLNYIPKNRVNETIYFNPADRDYPIVINPLEVNTKEEAELVVSGLMSIFTKVWANVWSARMEYILRNSLLSLSEIQGSTLTDVLRLLGEESYRNKVVQKMEDETLKAFWVNEFNKMPESLRAEAVSPIQNKVGQFVTSPMIRSILSQPRSTISLSQVMDRGMIFLANLSQGRLGEDNAALLGATLITKFQLAAMHRVDIPEEERLDFHLFVDEFQNFATDSFIKILSEARKYRLNLCLANQYMGQIPEGVQKAILGNAGSLVSFAVGADDAAIIHKEYAEVFSQNDLVNLANFQIAVKLMIDGHSTRPFLAHTLPLPASVNQNKQKVLEVSRQRWSKKAREG